MAYGPGLKPTLLGLARYAEIMQISQPHIHQLAGAKAPLVGGCDGVWDQPAREALIGAIQTAEEMIARSLGFWPAPKFIVDEWIRIEARRDWYNAEFQTGWRYIQAVGTESLTLLAADVPVVYSDEDEDPLGREETASITAPLYGDFDCELCGLAVFFRVRDGARDNGHPDFEIRNLRLDRSGTTIWGESSMFVIPTLWNLTEAECQGGGEWKWSFDVTNLVGYVDVYCRSVSNILPATLYWDGVCDCGSPCAHSTQTACVQVTDYQSGHFMVRPATWNGSSHVYTHPLHSRPPQKIKINYLAGYPLTDDCRMDPALERAVVKLTNSLLPEPPCGFCDPARQKWTHDRKPVEPLTQEAANIPWGLSTQGALEAWRIVKQFSLSTGKAKLGW